MGSNEPSNEKLFGQVENMVRERFLDGLTRLLEKRFPRMGDSFYEDAVAEAVSKLLAAGLKRDIENPRGYLTTIAVNEMRRAMKRAALEVLPGDDDEEDGESWADRIPDATASTEADGIGRVVYDHVRGLVGVWESTKLRETTLLVLAGAFVREVLTGDELTERLTDILDEDLDPVTVRQWRTRGLKRLRAQLTSEGFPLDD